MLKIFCFNFFVFMVLLQSTASQSSSPPGSYNVGSDTSIHFNSVYDSYSYLYNDPNMTGEDFNDTLSTVFSIQYCDQTISELIDGNKGAYKSLPNHPTNVNIQIIVNNIGGLSDRDQQAIITAFIDFRWVDPRLKGVFLTAGSDCSEANRTFITDDMLKIWFPLFTIDNSADKLLYNEAWEKFPGIIYPNGTVYWRSSFRLRLNCEMNFATFPFDGQNCALLIRSPNYRLTDVQYNFDRDRVLVFWDTESNSDPLWDVTGQSAYSTGGVPGIKIWIRYERKSSFYTWTLVLPTLVISILTSLTFILPADDSEKMTTILTGVLAYFLLLLALTGITPQVSENLPALAVFFVCTIGVGIAGAVATAVMLRWARMAPKTGKKGPITVCGGVSLEILNIFCLFLYIGGTGVCYVAYFLYVLDQGRRDDSLQKYNYTDINFY